MLEGSGMSYSPNSETISIAVGAWPGARPISGLRASFYLKSAECSTQLRKAGACDSSNNWLEMDSAAA
jgi:hypothetical protein